MSRESYLTDWKGETAYVQYILAKHLDNDAIDEKPLPTEFERYQDESPRYPIDAHLDPSRFEVYAFGLNTMVSSLVKTAERLGVPPEYTQFEGFG